jgi:transposase
LLFVQGARATLLRPKSWAKHSFGPWRPLKSNSTPMTSENLVRDIRRATRKHHAAEEKIRIVLDGLRGETSIAELCRREGIAESMYYSWSKEFLEAGKRRLAGDTARAATTEEVKQLRREAQDLKEVAERALGALAPDAQEPHPARELLPAWRSKSPDRPLRRALQLQALPRKLTEPDPGRRLLWQRPDHPPATKKDKTRHDQTATIATQLESRMSGGMILSRSASMPGIVQARKPPARADPWRWFHRRHRPSLRSR